MVIDGFGIEAFLETRDLIPAQLLLSAGAVLLSVYLMQLTWSDGESRRDCVTVRHLRRVSHAMVALGFLWCLSYGWRQGWQPWPPLLLIAAGVDLMLFVRIMAILFSQAGRRAPAPPVQPHQS